ncbi:hypothetical protein D3C78_1908390 [compost metagenome]|jgi:preprotein translocase subunit SecA
MKARVESNLERQEVVKGQTTSTSGGGETQEKRPVKREERVGRNDACPCGSGKKYKQCHGK